MKVLISRFNAPASVTKAVGLPKQSYRYETWGGKRHRLVGARLASSVAHGSRIHRLLTDQMPAQATIAQIQQFVVRNGAPEDLLSQLGIDSMCATQAKRGEHKLIDKTTLLEELESRLDQIKSAQDKDAVSTGALAKSVVVGGGEDCAHCGAQQERGDDGNCNSCHKPWPATTLASPHPDADGGWKGNCPHCGTTQFSDGPPESRTCSECKGPFDVERKKGERDLLFIPKVNGKRVGLPSSIEKAASPERAHLQRTLTARDIEGIRAGQRYADAMDSHQICDCGENLSSKATVCPKCQTPYAHANANDPFGTRNRRLLHDYDHGASLEKVSTDFYNPEPALTKSQEGNSMNSTSSPAKHLTGGSGSSHRGGHYECGATSEPQKGTNTSSPINFGNYVHFPIEEHQVAGANGQPLRAVKPPTQTLWRGTGGEASTTGKTFTAEGRHFALDNRYASMFDEHGQPMSYAMSPDTKLYHYDWERRSASGKGKHVLNLAESLHANAPQLLTKKLKALGYDGLVNNNIHGVEFVMWNHDKVAPAHAKSGEWSENADYMPGEPISWIGGEDPEDATWTITDELDEDGEATGRYALWHNSDQNGEPTDIFDDTDAAKGYAQTHMEKAFASGYPLQGRRSFRGLQISIENKKGAWRVDKAHTPPRWKTKMACDYGYLKMTQGYDGDHLDVFVGPNEAAPHVYIVRQLNPSTGAFDEQKFLLGFDSAREAKAMYLRHYDSPKFFGGLKGMPFEEFKTKALETLARTQAHGNKGGIIKGSSACSASAKTASGKAIPSFEEAARRNRAAIEEFARKTAPKTKEEEDARIKRNVGRVEAHLPHPFIAAQWTFGNGHPRCILCGDEEPVGGRCEGLGGLPKGHWAAKAQKKPLRKSVPLAHPGDLAYSGTPQITINRFVPLLCKGHQGEHRTGGKGTNHKGSRWVKDGGASNTGSSTSTEAKTSTTSSTAAKPATPKNAGKAGTRPTPPIKWSTSGAGMDELKRLWTMEHLLRRGTDAGQLNDTLRAQLTNLVVGSPATLHLYGPKGTQSQAETLAFAPMERFLDDAGALARYHRGMLGNSFNTTHDAGWAPADAPAALLALHAYVSNKRTPLPRLPQSAVAVSFGPSAESGSIPPVGLGEEVRSWADYDGISNELLHHLLTHHMKDIHQMNPLVEGESAHERLESLQHVKAKTHKALASPVAKCLVARYAQTPLSKAHVGAHTRMVNGKMVQVHDYDTKQALGSSIVPHATNAPSSAIKPVTATATPAHSWPTRGAGIGELKRLWEMEGIIHRGKTQRDFDDTHREHLTSLLTNVEATHHNSVGADHLKETLGKTKFFLQRASDVVDQHRKRFGDNPSTTHDAGWSAEDAPAALEAFQSYVHKKRAPLPSGRQMDAPQQDRRASFFGDKNGKQVVARLPGSTRPQHQPPMSAPQSLGHEMHDWAARDGVSPEFLHHLVKHHRNEIHQMNPLGDNETLHERLESLNDLKNGELRPHSNDMTKCLIPRLIRLPQSALSKAHVEAHTRMVNGKAVQVHAYDTDEGSRSAGSFLIPGHAPLSVQGKQHHEWLSVQPHLRAAAIPEHEHAGHLNETHVNDLVRNTGWVRQRNYGGLLSYGIRDDAASWQAARDHFEKHSKPGERGHIMVFKPHPKRMIDGPERHVHAEGPHASKEASESTVDLHAAHKAAHEPEYEAAIARDLIAKPPNPDMPLSPEKAASMAKDRAATTRTKMTQAKDNPHDEGLLAAHKMMKRHVLSTAPGASYLRDYQKIVAQKTKIEAPRIVGEGEDWDPNFEESNFDSSTADLRRNHMQEQRVARLRKGLSQRTLPRLLVKRRSFVSNRSHASVR